jgi:hypothetical protein
MSKVTNWLDQRVRRACEWLDDFFSGKHFLASAGYRLAGLARPSTLPVDRRETPNIVFAGGERKDGGKWVRITKKQTTLLFDDSMDKKDEYWAYCNMKGQPCTWCGGTNHLTPAKTTYPDLPAKEALNLDANCPPNRGTTVGSTWWGCCEGPNGVRLIGNYDCCGPKIGKLEVCGPYRRITNWRQAKHWCADAGRYLCTIAVDGGECVDI